MKNRTAPSHYLFSNCLVISTVLILSVNARDSIFGTPDIDSDGDGDPVSGNFGFQVDSGITDSGTGNPIYNTLGFQESADTEYWVTAEQGGNHWRDYTNSLNQDTNMAARVRETLSPGDSYFYRQSSYFAMEEYTMSWRDSNGNLPTGTLISFGFGMDGLAADIDSGTVEGTSNLTNLAGSDGPNSGTTSAPTGFDSAMGEFLWYNYQVDTQNSQSVFTIRNPTFMGNSTVISDIIWYIQFPNLLDAGETMPEYTPWALSGYDKNGDFVSVEPGEDYWLTSEGDEDSFGDPIAPQNDDPTNDLVFSWTVDNKTTEWGSSNINFVIPEPSMSFIAAISMLTLTFRRRRK